MLSQGPYTPSTVVTDSSIGTDDWISPTYAKVEDGNTAYVYVVPGFISSYYLKATGFTSFSIPTGAIIDHIVVGIKVSASSEDGVKYASVKIVKGGTIQGAEMKDTTPYYFWVSTPTWVDFPGPGYGTSLWELSWTASDINSTDFGVAVAAFGVGGGASTAYVDCIRITVYYKTAPTVTTQAATSITSSGCTGNGNITNTGGVNATRRGFCYVAGTSGDPTTANSVAYDDGSFGEGAYTKAISGLSSGAGYRVRAYAVNSVGTSYGATVQVTTLSAIGSNIIIF